MNKFNRIIGEAADGIPKAQESYKDLGIQIRKDDGSIKNSATLLLEVAEAFKDIEDPAMKAKKATDLFGRAGIDLIPMLQNGADDILTFESRLRDAGGVLNEAATKDIAAFNDSLDLLSRVTLVSFSKILVPILPALTVMAGNFDNIAKAVGRRRRRLCSRKDPDFARRNHRRSNGFDCRHCYKSARSDRRRSHGNRDRRFCL